MLLLELDPEKALQQRSPAEGANAEQLRRHARVEDVADLPTVIALQEAKVVIGVVKDDLDGGILQHAAPSSVGDADRESAGSITAVVSRVESWRR